MPPSHFLRKTKDLKVSRESYVCETLSLDNNGLSGDHKPEGFFSSDFIVKIRTNI